MDSKPIIFKNSRQVTLALIGLVSVGFALSAGRLGLVVFPGLRIAQILLALGGFFCILIASAISQNGARQWALRLARSPISLTVGSTLAGLLLCEIISLAVETFQQRQS